MAFDVERWLRDHLPGGRTSNKGWYRVLCPFHTEKTSSFAVHTTNGNFVCRSVSCGSHGGIQRLLVHVEGITWAEAYRKTGTPNPWNVDEDIPNLEMDVRRRATVNAFPTTAKPIADVPPYLVGRGYGPDDVLAFGLQVGVVNKRSCILFPFWNFAGEYKTYTARNMAPTGFRYKQADESLAASLLYGAWRFAGLTSLKRFWVVEGQFDVLRMWQLGLPAVGLSTASATALQRDQIAELSRLFGAYVYIMLDTGAHETASARKISAQLWSRGVSAFCQELPEGVKDPDRLDSRFVPNLLDFTHETEVSLTQGAMTW